ncbi:polymorphic toxin type 43 domain-containing protein [Rhodoferax antarcticus]|uniref:polymorphic toxin type 43 domain-containing protein n=1 Tax=Rhodoferax antarcticus TaxID=81479 RepID=UPI0022242472|nr:polymorphic toxin type 43 domain-containing protein [Rhodoferax antarcticus]MCW2314440.1 hypothetical protein [Rhodoferax antarcticus]
MSSPSFFSRHGPHGLHWCHWLMLFALAWAGLTAQPFEAKTASGQNSFAQSFTHLVSLSNAQENVSAPPVGANGGVGAAPVFSGSGPAPGVIAITDASSVGALKNYTPSGRAGIEFVFDPTTNTFAVGKPQAGLFNGSAHEQLAQSIGANKGEVLGGTFGRNPNGSIFTTENSGHYGDRWTPELRAKFEGWLSDRLITPVNQQPWISK